MKARELIKMGFPEGPVIAKARAAAGKARVEGYSKHKVRSILGSLLTQPEQYKTDSLFGGVAETLIESGIKSKPRSKKTYGNYDWDQQLEYKVWGEDIDAEAHKQMSNACRLPISVAGALMPDAHVGYGLPIGGVLATDNAVIPYAVGVDIACRMMLTVFDLPPEEVENDQDKYKKVLQDNTRFGIGAEWKPRRQHPVMDENWRASTMTARVKDLAYKQLGTSGSGNHFVEFGEFTIDEPLQKAQPGRYLAVLSHSGSRGAGNKIATHYSKWAMSIHHDMPKELRHLAWLNLDSDGAEYWAAMELMGKYASANHHIIHKQIANALGETPLIQIENHHNFAWRERHNDREVIVHRKGATPAGQGVLGIIPGSMASPAYLIEGKGDPSSLNSASHGAGRRISRKAAMRQFKWAEIKKYLNEKGVTLLSAGLDEAPWVYKDIDEVMEAQTTLVRPLARFMPRLVKMAPHGERPED